MPLVKILDEVEDYKFAKRFRIVRATLQHIRFDNSMSEPITRISFERGDSIGVLLYDPQEDAVILVRQFRYSIYAKIPPNGRDTDAAKQAWILEVVAGVMEADAEAEEVANKEILEEAGYKLESGLQYVMTTYPSPGGSSESIALFIGEVSHRERETEGGGVPEEGEDIQVVVIPFDEAMGMIARGEIQDAKAIILLQYLALMKSGSEKSFLKKGY